MTCEDFHIFKNMTFDENSLFLLRFGIVLSNAENGDLEIQRVDSPDEFGDEGQYDFVIPKLKSDELAKELFEFLPKTNFDCIWTLEEYSRKMNVKEKFETLQEIQDFLQNEYDLTIWDYPLNEYEDIKDNYESEFDILLILTEDGNVRLIEN